MTNRLQGDGEQQMIKNNNRKQVKVNGTTKGY